jgi:leucyl/phenylalanyl-tRNA--protein transferase
VVEITAEMLLRAYAAGVFPMAERRDSDSLYWFNPDKRGILPLDAFHVPRRLGRTVLGGRFEVSADRDFAAVLAGCAEATVSRPETWINRQIVDLYDELHRRGFAHSVECRRDGQLVGGLYGVALGGAFFGESMFSRERDASKVALVHLVARLRLGGFVLLDTQFVTAHLRQFGAVEIDRQDYLRRLEAALKVAAAFQEPSPSSLTGALRGLCRQSSTQTS